MHKKTLNKQVEQCIDCFKIKCRQCGWEATEEEVVKIQEGILVACPVCAWAPKDG